ncbi:hypothetical protein FJT64_002946 [Amphibalanus amphitrite]|uniref:Uncharacterized protein n=1 Tax=Amphibalanus amphitrite TaxID=1232801 RepID=A0A6A4WGE1_AMPAM|nr:hypothetical protein FJT64_002946 [Amphibalanus amphitrite]
MDFSEDMMDAGDESQLQSAGLTDSNPCSVCTDMMEAGDESQLQSAGLTDSLTPVLYMMEAGDESQLQSAGLTGTVDEEGRVRIVLADGTTVMADLSDISGLDTAGTERG